MCGPAEVNTSTSTPEPLYLYAMRISQPCHHHHTTTTLATCLIFCHLYLQATLSSFFLSWIQGENFLLCTLFGAESPVTLARMALPCTQDQSNSSSCVKNTRQLWKLTQKMLIFSANVHCSRSLKTLKSFEINFYFLNLTT